MKYRIVQSEYVFNILYSGGLKSCERRIDSIKQTYPDAIIEPVSNTLEQACNRQGWISRN